MSKGVEEHWLDGWVGRGRAPGGSGAVQVVVTGLPSEIVLLLFGRGQVSGLEFEGPAQRIARLRWSDLGI